MRNIVLLLFSLITISAYSQSELKLASDVWPPFTDVESEKSIAIDLVREALVRNNINTAITIQDFTDVIKNIDAGLFDGSAALWASEERQKKYFFSESYLQNQLILVGKKGSDVSATSFDDFESARIGIIEDYSYGAVVNSDKVMLLAGNNDQENLERLLSDEIDYMLVDALLIQYLLKYQVNDVSEYLEIGSTPIIVKSLHFAIRKDVPNAEKIIADFNNEIHEMIAEGVYNKILELNWVRADLDGDGELELILDGDAAGTAPPENTYGVYTDQSLVKKSNSPNKYYIKGQMYNSWDQVPQEYKTEIVMSTQNPKDTGIKLNF